jgi:hypothetical protein
MLRRLKFFQYIYRLLNYFFLKLIKTTGRLKKFLLFLSKLKTTVHKNLMLRTLLILSSKHTKNTKTILVLASFFPNTGSYYTSFGYFFRVFRIFREQ